MNNEIANAGANQDGCTYILHMLLQRLEVTHPGITLDMLRGAQADKAAVEVQGTALESATRRFEASIAILELIHAQNQMNSSS